MINFKNHYVTQAYTKKESEKYIGNQNYLTQYLIIDKQNYKKFI